MPVLSIEQPRHQQSMKRPDTYLHRGFSSHKQNVKGRATHFSDPTAEAAASPSGRSVSNLQRFLYHTTPRTSCQLYSKCIAPKLDGFAHPSQIPDAGTSALQKPDRWTRARGLSSKGCLASASSHFFSLSDLWNSFDEWSAYGAGVPIVLNGKETVMQYYVPYLSAIQLYTSVSLPRNRRIGDDSDGSEMGSSDGEVEKACVYERRASSPELNGNLAFDREQGPIRYRRRQWSSLDMRLMEDDDIWQEEDVSESLVYEYFETAAPSFRVPLHDKVGELARQFPALKTLTSNDLSRSSWLSVAWYPIYRIPIGPTLKDLAACFLTYHQLSTPPADETHGLSQELGCSPYNDQIVLHPFGLVSYKVRGAIWTSAGVADRQYAMILQRSSDDWLKNLHVQHPDFKFFMSRGPWM